MLSRSGAINLTLSLNAWQGSPHTILGVYWSLQLSRRNIWPSSRIVQPISFWKAAKFDRWTISVGPASAKNDRLIIILDMAIIFWSKLFFLVILQLVLKMTVTRQILLFPATTAWQVIFNFSGCLTGNLARNNCLITLGSQLSVRFEFPDFPYHFSSIFPDLTTQIWHVSHEIPSVARNFFFTYSPTTIGWFQKYAYKIRHKIWFTPARSFSLTLHKKNIEIAMTFKKE